MMIMQGWQCPCCKMVYAPTVTSCGCEHAKAQAPWSSRKDGSNLAEEIRKARMGGTPIDGNKPMTAADYQREGKIPW